MPLRSPAMQLSRWSSRTVRGAERQSEPARAPPTPVLWILAPRIGQHRWATWVPGLALHARPGWQPNKWLCPAHDDPSMALKHDRLVPLIVAVALFMENMDSTVISTSLPAIAADIGTSPLALKLAVTCYLLSLAIFIPASGWTADRFRARTVF